VKLLRINTFLLIGIILINGITIGMPFIPSLLFKIEVRGGLKQQQLRNKIQANEQPPKLQPNQLIMPTALFDQQIFEGPDTRTLQRGVWLRPNSSPPGHGNTVLVAHRFTYSNPRGAFYNLDKLKVGDLVGVIWNNQTLRYVVRETKVVGQHDTYIEASTNTIQLTLYTCTPLTLPKDRLVVIATLDEGNHD
jgi:LPXTG-site transpeptidase (sortase) family protein